MAIDEQYLRVRRSLEEKLGVEEASYLMDRPVGGWSELVTNHTLDLKFEVVDERFKVLDARFEAIDDKLVALDHRIATQFEAMEHKLLGEIDRRSEALAWKLVTAVIGGMGVMGAVFGALVVVAGS